MGMYFRTKMGNYDGDFAERISYSSGQFFLVPLGMEKIIKYTEIKVEGSDKYISLLSNYLYKKDHNLVLTVMGPSQTRVDEIMQQYLDEFEVEVLETADAVQFCEMADKKLKEGLDFAMMLAENN
ncbi:MAG: hypothetical protein U9P44_03375 [archaeon]|nr:hypothetical protein [archaeon]